MILPEMVVKCPECGQQVKGREIRSGEKVECPACFFRFTVPGQVPDIEPHSADEGDGVAGQAAVDQNFYRKKSVQSNVIVEPGTLPAQPNRRVYEPIKGWQYVIGVIALMIAGGTWAFLMLEERLRSTFLSGMELHEQRIFAGFFALIAGVLLWIVGRRQLWWCRILAVVIVVGLPLLVRQHVGPTGDGLEDKPAMMLSSDFELPEDQEQTFEHIDDYSQTDLAPLYEAVEQLGRNNVLGTWIRGVNPSNQGQLSSYLYRMAQIKTAPQAYHRHSGALFTLAYSPLSFSEFLEILEPIGEVLLSDPQMKFVDLRLKPGALPAAASPSVLQNPSDPGFLEANEQELRSLDMRRISAAATRLAKEQPREMQKEIAAQLMKLIREPWGFDTLYVTALGQALVVWAEPGDETAEALIAYIIRQFHEGGKEIPNEFATFVVTNKYSEAILVMGPVWEAAPYRWEDYLVELGPPAEPYVIETLGREGIPLELRYSALRILERIGLAGSLEIVRPLTESDDTETANLARAAVREIEKRTSLQPQPEAVNP